MTVADTTANPRASRGAASTSRRVVSPELVGRERELELLLDAAAHPPAVAVVEGEAGIGKSRLVGELAARLQAGGRRSGADVSHKASPHKASPTCRVLVGRCHRVREPFPLGPVLEAVRSLGTEIGRLGLSPLGGALRPLIPELAGHLPPALEPLGDTAADRHRVFRALVEVLSAVGPAVLVLEDLHWASDGQTTEFLGFLTDDQPENLTVVMTFRGEEVADELRTIVARPPSSTMSVRVELSPLDAERTGQLSASILDLERVSEEFAGYLHERTDGVPFAVEEVLALLRDREGLVRGGDGWQRAGLDELAVPKAIRDSVLERLARLPASARAVTEAVAVLQSATSAQVVAEVSDMDHPAAAEALSAAIDASLLEGKDGTVGFRHVLAAEAVYEAVPDPRRRQLHARAADALAALEPQPLGQLAHHLQRAGRLTEWTVAAEEAADQAVELGNHDEAARLLADVLRHAPLSRDERGRLAVKLGRTVNDAVRGVGELVGLLSEALREDLARPVRGELRFWTAQAVERMGGDPVRRHRLFRQAAEDLDDRPDLQAWAMMALAIPTGSGVSLSEHKAWLRRALDVVPRVADPRAELVLVGKAAMLLILMGDPRWRDLAERVGELSGPALHIRAAVNAHGSIGVALCYVGHHDEARHLLARAGADAVACGSRRLQLYAQAAGALLDFYTGRWDGHGGATARMLEELADDFMAGSDARVAAGCLALVRGDVDDAERRLSEVSRQLQALDIVDMVPIVDGTLARLAVARGDGDTAQAALARLRAALKSKELWALAPRALPAMVQALLVAGQAGEARTLLDAATGELAGLDAPLAPAALRHAHGHLAAGTRDWAGAAEQFLAAAELYEPLECPYEAAQAREQAALAMFEAADARAKKTLRAAMDAYRELGASWDLTRATRAARAHGITVPVPHRRGRKGYGDRLSPREERVARLAAEGRTNKEIAAELFLSVHTVSNQLSAAMRKLGVQNRAALGQRIL